MEQVKGVCFPDKLFWEILYEVTITSVNLLGTIGFSGDFSMVSNYIDLLWQTMIYK